MATFEYKPGLGNVGSYQASGKPWVSSSLVVPAENGVPLDIHFPTVTKEITVRNDSTGSIRVGFSALGVSGSGTNYFTLAENGSFTSPVKVTDIFLISDTAAEYEATVVAALTGIDSEFIVENWTGSLGVG
tara:strand:+ start:2230 stop:2622 length:393 start_codon:yes stop_codon:yes gene_type:complete